MAEARLQGLTAALARARGLSQDCRLILHTIRTRGRAVHGGIAGSRIESDERFFLGVERSASGRAWRDRLDARGQARALAIAQRHGLPELLARVLAGRGVEADAVESLSRSRPSSG